MKEIFATLPDKAPDKEPDKTSEDSVIEENEQEPVFAG